MGGFTALREPFNRGTGQKGVADEDNGDGVRDPRKKKRKKIQDQLAQGCAAWTRLVGSLSR